MTSEGVSREERAKALFRQGYNCCQAVLLAFQDVTGLDTDALLKVSSGLGGGMARMRETCGTVSAMAIIAGFLSPATDPSVHSQRTSNYALVQKLAAEFRDRNGSISCRELLSLKSAGWQAPEPSVRTDEFYRTRPCERFVGDAAGILEAWMAEDMKENV